jgi:hypothetical protein
MRYFIALFLCLAHQHSNAQSFVGNIPDSSSLNMLTEFFWNNPANDTSMKWSVVVRATPSTKKYINNNYQSGKVKMSESEIFLKLRNSFFVRVVGGDVATPNIVIDIFFNNILIRKLYIVYNHYGKIQYGGVVNSYFGYAIFENPKKFIEAISMFEIQDF